MTTVFKNMPIKWFGNRKSYFKSDVKIITVALNPSDRELTNVSLLHPGGDRFPDFNGSEESLNMALDNYFMHQPYDKWFKRGFEGVLNGANASYYDMINTLIMLFILISVLGLLQIQHGQN